MNIKPLTQESSEEERAARSRKLVDDYLKRVGDTRTREQREEDLKKMLYYTPEEGAKRIKELKDGPPYQLQEDTGRCEMVLVSREEMIENVKKRIRP